MQASAHKVTKQAAVHSCAGSVRITGALTDDAQLRYSPGENPHAVLFLTISQAGGLPYEVRQDCGSNSTEIIAVISKARRLLMRGAVVTVYAKGITLRTDHGHAVLKLDGVTDVIPHLTNQPNQEH